MPQQPNRVQDFQLDFSAGVNSNVVTTIASQNNPNGLRRNQLAWLVNGTVRGGGVLPRNGWNYLVTVHDGSLQYQGGWLYDATALGGNPYLMLSLGGRIFQVRVDTDNSVHDVTLPNDPNPVNVPQAYFGQGEQFMVIQAGDFGLVPNPRLPLFWDGNHLRRSNGITGITTPGNPNINELPAAGPMSYYSYRIWYGQGRLFTGGDIVFSSSGTAQYNFTDSVLKVTQNPLALLGDGFAVPSQAGNITALAYPISLDQTFGQGPLFAFTRNQVYSLIVPISRAAWIAADGVNSQPLLTVVGQGIGTTSYRSVVAVNSDLWFSTVTPAISSYVMATRYFSQWQNSPLSNNMNRLLFSQNRALMNTVSAINFGNRLYMTAQPITTGVGTAFPALAVMDFDPISTLQNQQPPCWEGSIEGFQFLQLFSGDYGGLPRAFATVLSELDGSIQVWEMVQGQQFDCNKAGESRIDWQLETPAFTCGDEEQFMKLDTCHFWFDKISGNVVVKVQFRPDGDGCWHDWITFKMCSARNSVEAGEALYPVLQFCAQDRRPIVLPKAPEFDCNLSNQRPINRGYQFQLKLILKGFAELREIRMFCQPIERNIYDGIIC